MTSKARFHVMLYHKTRYKAFISGLLISLHLLFFFRDGAALPLTAPFNQCMYIGTSGFGSESRAASIWKADRLISWIEELQECSIRSFAGVIHSTACWRSLHRSPSCSMPSLPFWLLGALMAPPYIHTHSVPPDCCAQRSPG